VKSLTNSQIPPLECGDLSPRKHNSEVSIPAKRQHDAATSHRTPNRGEEPRA